MHLLANGSVLMWQDDNDSGARGTASDTVAYVWNVQQNSFTRVYNTTTDLFCSGHAFLPDGRLLVAGGHNQSDNNGTTTTNLFDPNTGSWTLSNYTMNQGRWYPTVTSLANGDMLVVSGNVSTNSGVNAIPEVWSTSGTDHGASLVLRLFLSHFIRGCTLLPMGESSTPVLTWPAVTWIQPVLVSGLLLRITCLLPRGIMDRPSCIRQGKSSWPAAAIRQQIQRR